MKAAQPQPSKPVDLFVRNLRNHNNKHHSPPHIKSFSEMYNQIVNPKKPSQRTAHKSQSESKSKDRKDCKDRALPRSKSNCQIGPPQPHSALRRKTIKAELASILHRLNHTTHIHLHDNECFLDLQSFLEVMRQMKYFNGKESEAKARKLWEGLGGEQYGGFLAGNLQVLVQALEGVAKGSPPKEDDTKLSGELRLELSDRQAKEIFNNHSEFRHNRVMAEERIAHKLKSKAQQKDNDSDFQQITLVARLAKSRQSNTRKDSEAAKNQIKRPSNYVSRQESSQKKVLIKDKQNISSIAQKGTSTCKISLFKQSPQCGLLLKDMEKIASRKVPLLSVDVNLGQGRTEKIIVYQGDTARQISFNLAAKYSLNEEMRCRFQSILQNHISGLLTRIDELPQQTSQHE